MTLRISPISVAVTRHEFLAAFDGRQCDHERGQFVAEPHFVERDIRCRSDALVVVDVPRLVALQHVVSHYIGALYSRD